MNVLKVLPSQTDFDFTSGVSLGMERLSSPLSLLLLAGSSGFSSRPAACSACCIWAIVTSRALTCSARSSMIALLVILRSLRRLRTLRVLRVWRLHRRGGGGGVAYLN
ncbi:hypothetical protein LXL04_036028 [Taraxacum kok-saghyz]